MTAWRNRNEGCFWAFKLDVRDLGGHLDVTLRAVAGTLTNRIKIATTQVPAVGALPLGFQRMLGMVRSKYLPGGLHGCEGAAVSVTALSSFRSAISRAVWSKKLPMTNTPALLSLLDGPWGSDPAFFVIWNRFRQLRRYLACRPDDQDRIFVYLIMPLLVPRGMVLFIFSFSLLMSLVFSGILIRLVGLGLVFLLFV